MNFHFPHLTRLRTHKVTDHPISTLDLHYKEQHPRLRLSKRMLAVQIRRRKQSVFWCCPATLGIRPTTRPSTPGSRPQSRALTHRDWPPRTRCPNRWGWRATAPGKQCPQVRVGSRVHPEPTSSTTSSPDETSVDVGLVWLYHRGGAGGGQIDRALRAAARRRVASSSRHRRGAVRWSR